MSAGVREARWGPACWVTLGRAALAAAVAALVADSFAHGTPVTLLVTLASVALALDLVDGWVARRTGTATALGARFDGEVDAFLILALSVHAAPTYGAWVLGIGGARYLFAVGEWLLPWMRAPIPPRRWRKVVAATQGVVLTVAAAGVLPRALIQALLALALVLLAASMAECVWWLSRRRHVAGVRRSGRTGAAPALTVVALAVLLPATPRRLPAVVVGAALAVVVLVKALDIGFWEVFDRPFNPYDDWSHRGTAVETLRDAFGRSHADLAFTVALTLVVALFLVLIAAALRITGVAAGHRGRALPALCGLAVACAILRVLGAPVASTSAIGLAVHEAQDVRFGLHDRARLAREIAHDRFRATPADRLLTGLRGEDVLLLLVESYGKAAVQGSAFSSRVDAVPDDIPWTRIPRLVPWDEVGDGSILHRLPAEVSSRGALFSRPAAVSFVQRYGRENLVLVVLGDHQPATIVTGQNASHDVPVSVIAHDPRVIDRISGWGRPGGMRPGPRAPVWRMDAFRDRFPTAFGP
jgi:phosphatidylglycerophosphate synthase